MSYYPTTCIVTRDTNAHLARESRDEYIEEQTEARLAEMWSDLRQDARAFSDWIGCHWCEEIEVEFFKLTFANNPQEVAAAQAGLEALFFEHMHSEAEAAVIDGMGNHDYSHDDYDD